MQSSRRNIVQNTMNLRELQFFFWPQPQGHLRECVTGHILNSLVQQDLLTCVTLSGPSCTANLQPGLLPAESLQLVKPLPGWTAAAGVDAGLAELGSGCLQLPVRQQV